MTEATNEVVNPQNEVWRSRLNVAIQLTKIRLNLLVLFTTFSGACLASDGVVEFAQILHVLFGTLVTACGASVLNQVWERETDARMRRTRERPLPAGKIEARDATLLGLLLGLGGVMYLAYLVNLLTALLGLTTLLTYVLVYTPMKMRSQWNTAVGAIGGALPPVMGWTAVRADLSTDALFLFAILFMWQFPHFLALSWMHREDYARGGIRIVAVNDPTGQLSGKLTLATCVMLVAISCWYFFAGHSGTIYAVGALVGAAIFLVPCVDFFRRPSSEMARRAFLASLLYLPLILVATMLDQVI